jgi:carbon storage regulator
VIAGNITVTVIEVKGRQVRLGIDAPGNVTVHRQEIAERIAAETAQSRQAKGGVP